MKRHITSVLIVILLVLTFSAERAETATMADYTAIPPFVGTGASPLVMMIMGRDHKLYYEAYNDASDINGDGVLDVGYNHSIDYYGYFDSNKCYQYTTTGTARFTAGSTTTDKFCAGGSNYWSGNFLNWLSMSRMDALRKVFYGGYRSTDSSSATYLEGAYIPQDAHSWGKEFTGRLCYDGISTYTTSCSTLLDCNAGDTCVDKSQEILGINAATAPTTCTASAVSWTKTGQIFVGIYNHTVQTCGTSHSDLMNSYEPASYSKHYYVTDFNDIRLDPSVDHEGDDLNIMAVADFDVAAGDAGLWEFVVDSDDGAEVEINGTVISPYYGCHGACFGASGNPASDNSNFCSGQLSGTISLLAGTHRFIARSSERSGGEGVRVWYKKPGDANWTIFGNTLTIKAPDIVAGNECSIKDISFINTGDPFVGTTVSGTAKRHLFCTASLSDGAAPKIRLLQNNANRVWSWASKESPVCDTSLGTPTDYDVRVEVCDTTAGLESNCRYYPGGSGLYKPAGLFQKYGESTDKVCSKTYLSCNTDSDCGSTSDDVCIDKGQMYFGLMTGSYTKNLSGGVVRWNIDSITHDVDNRNVGQLKNQGMLKTMDNLKIVDFDYGSKSYNSNCGWITTRAMNEGECRMWGNPIAEMMYEAERYFAGKSAPTSSYAAGTSDAGTDDDGLGLTNQSDADNNGTNADNWIAPYNKYPSCAKPFIIVISDVNPSYDSDQIPGADSNFGSFSGDLAGLDVSTMTDTIGSTEGINGTNAFIGQSGTTFDSICSSKSVTGLGSIRGLCPEEPTKQGSYYSAAVAHYGKTQFGANNGNLPDITTYSVALQSPVPDIDINVGGDTVTIVPIGKSISGCLSVYNSCDQKCTLSYNATTGLTISSCAADAYCPSNQIVDFYVDTLGTGLGKFRINFEDVEQGADHDMDAIVEYDYCVGSSCSPAVSSNQVKITLDSSVYAAGCIDQVLGFVVSGTTEDGAYLPVKDDDVADSSDSDTPTVVATMPRTWSKTFTASSGGSSTALIKNPLWYAAKWGGFEDQNANNIPDLNAEWDKDGDGVPDTYFLVTNPLELEQKLTAVFADILKKSASGTSVSILATSAEGEGALYQAYFYPEKVMTDGSTREWLGYCRGLFLDNYGNLREDTNSDGALVLNQDNILRLRLDTSTNAVKADLFVDADEDGVPDTITPASTVGIDSIIPLWESGEALGKRIKSNRDIYVWVDTDNNGVVANGDFSSLGGEAQSFTNDAGHRALLKPYLRGTDDTETGKIIDFVRGNAVSGYRNRCIPISGATKETGCANATERVWALGNIVYSTPTTVAQPKEQYDLLYGGNATSYTAFRTAYNNRRQVIYVGANDGALHAFNAGVYTAGDDSTTASDTEHGWFLDGPSSGNGWSGLSLGDELWAFIPHDNLPHLKWLTQTDYSHVYYTDLKPKPTDVRIFCDSDASLSPPTSPNCVNGQSSASHPGGWGTILIVGMRLGGGNIDVTADFGSGSETRTFRSAYYALDITDPEQKPRLLWRFTDSGLGFSTSYPAIGHIKSGSSEKWFMVVGSGPDNFEPGANPNNTRGYDGLSNQYGKVFIVDILDGSLDKTFTTDANAFMGDPTVVDGELDYTADVIYIGTAYDTPGNPVEWTNGKMYRINTNGDIDPANWALSTFFSYTGLGPVLNGPSVSKDKNNNFWVFTGSGRFWSSGDKVNSDQQRYYGIKDACWKENSTLLSCNTTYALTDLYSASSIVVSTSTGSNTQVSGDTTACGGSSTCSYSTMLAYLQTKQGWYVDLVDSGTIPSERVLSKSVVLGGIVLFTSFTPNSDICSLQGDSALYALYYETGTSYFKSVIGTTSGTIDKRMALGKGIPTTIGMALGKTTKGFIQTSTGAIVEISADTAGGRSGTAAWREKAVGGSTTGVEEIYKHIVK